MSTEESVGHGVSPPWDRLVRRSYALVRWINAHPRLFPVASDCGSWLIALAIGAVLKLAFGWTEAFTELMILGVIAVTLQAAAGRRLGIYRHRWKFSSFEEVTALSLSWLLVTTVLAGGNFVFRFSTSDLPTSAVLTGAILAFVLMAATRGAWRRFWELKRRPSASQCRRTIVFGAGEAGTQMVKAMLSDPKSEFLPVALLDDNPEWRRRVVHGVPVEGSRRNMAEVAERHDASVLLIAIPSADAMLIQDASNLAAEANLEVRVLPATSELMHKLTIADVRPPTVDDLLGRDPVEIDLESVAGYIRGKRVLITGAGGSIGSELSRQVSRFEPSELYLLDRDESALHGLQLSMEGRALLDTDRLVVADIRDGERMREVFRRHQPQVVFHTAALKHLTLLENHPMEGVKTNTAGTRNLLEAAREAGVERFVNISTDKAANPSSVLGATKLAAERLTAQMARETGRPYLSVRFGNVLGSRGSVLPTFLKQLEDGRPLTVTDPEATRFFMTIPEAVRLVVQAGAIGEQGEVLILDMGQPVKIAELAQQLANLMRPGTPIEFTGLRPGEKLHEILVATDEVGTAKVHPRIIHAPASSGRPIDALDLLDDDLRHEAERVLLHRAPAVTH